MREDHNDIQAPKKENLPISSNRKAKPMNTPSKKLHHQQQKSIKKSLCSAFTPVNEDDVVLNSSENESIEMISAIADSVDADQLTVQISKTSLNSNHTLVSDNTVVLQHPEESVKISPISEAFACHEDQSGESIQGYIVSLNQFISPSSVTPASPAVTTTVSSLSPVATTPSSSSSSTIPAEAAAVLVASVPPDEATTEEMNSFKLELLVKHLRESMFQVLHSSDIDLQYKKLLDALVKKMIEEFYDLHEDRNMVVQLFSKKAKILLLSFAVCILAVSTGLILFSDALSSYSGPSPT